jgi:hypothetical protein
MTTLVKVRRHRKVAVASTKVLNGSAADDCQNTTDRWHDRCISNCHLVG